ncbi:MAG TPA: hypothetical protein PKD24_17260 [Pyrinomonadaceae bacterium]|nr:hypothetical protein [Pyrinomonadaceae bacterium]HMP67110.1 hypothetical protein [Pyrinomonadaceae bacterium]
MKDRETVIRSEKGSAGIKALLVILVLVVIGNAGINYIPIAYEGANFRQEMDTAVVKGLATSGQMKPMDVVRNHVEKAAADNNVPPDAIIEIKPMGTVITAHVVYTKEVNLLPFGIYKYKYNFNHRAAPTGYLTKQ